MKSQKTIFYLSIVGILIILIMGGWWLYLMNYLSQQLVSRGIEAPDIIRLTKWEGSTFLVIILLITSTMYYYYYRMIQKNQAMQAFFASLTHELKTPLASIRLQGEVINEMANAGQTQKLPKLCDRLTQDTNSLEMQMDKVLQLSQVERGRKLKTHETNLSHYLANKLASDQFQTKDVSIIFQDQSQGQSHAYVDSFALDHILRNLMENTKRHSKSNQAQINLIQHQETLEIEYSDGGEFKGDPNRIGELFVKGEKSKGSGIGLYLIDQMSKAMNGYTKFSFDPFKVHVHLQKGESNI